MISVGEFFDPERKHPLTLSCAVDADRGVELLRDAVSGTFCLVFTNGQVKKRVAFSKEAGWAALAVLETALVNGWPDEEGEIA